MGYPTVALAALLTSLPNAPVSADEAKVPDALPGVWALVSTEDASRTDRGDDNCRMSIRPDGDVVLKIGELTTNTGKIVAARADNANHIDFKFKTGVVLGVYERQGDRLVICCDREANGRPTSLRPKGTQWRETWRIVRELAGPCVQP